MKHLGQGQAVENKPEVTNLLIRLKNISEKMNEQTPMIKFKLDTLLYFGDRFNRTETRTDYNCVFDEMAARIDEIENVSCQLDEIISHLNKIV